MVKAGFIGYGNMGSSLAAGIASSLSDWKIGVFDIDPDKTKRAETDCGAKVFGTYEELGSFADIVVLAVKPQYLEAAANKAGNAFKDKPVISILAGTSMETVSAALSTKEVARFMPNIAASMHKAVTAVTFSQGAGEQFKNHALQAAEACGRAVILDEKLFGAFTGLSGSGIAYVFQMIHAMALAGTKQGIPYSSSLEIALGTMDGAVQLVSRSGEHPTALLSRVISPGGTTIEGISQLEKMGLTPAIISAVEAASMRANELEK